jgi:hypothetical protein
MLCSRRKTVGKECTARKRYPFCRMLPKVIYQLPGYVSGREDSPTAIRRSLVDCDPRVDTPTRRRLGHPKSRGQLDIYLNLGARTTLRTSSNTICHLVSNHGKPLANVGTRAR